MINLGLKLKAMEIEKVNGIKLIELKVNDMDIFKRRYSALKHITNISNSSPSIPL